MIQIITPVSDVDLTGDSNYADVLATAGGEAVRSLLQKLQRFHMVVCGTGLRHLSIASDAIERQEVRVTRLYSPKLGRAGGHIDRENGDGRVMLITGIAVPTIEYGPYDLTWEFLGKVLIHTLVCADTAALAELCQGGIVQPGAHLYQADADKKTIRLVA